MEYVTKMLQTHPAGSSFDFEELSECITSCYSCAQTCTACADACLDEDKVKELRKCIRLNLDCADICLAAGNMMSRLTSVSDELMANQIKACAAACEICGRECDSHQQHEHCRICADACNKCKEACDKMHSSISSFEAI